MHRMRKFTNNSSIYLLVAGVMIVVVSDRRRVKYEQPTTILLVGLFHKLYYDTCGNSKFAFPSQYNLA
jgi:hypothetical protein